jgi:hypothetical protein
VGASRKKANTQVEIYLNLRGPFTTPWRQKHGIWQMAFALKGKMKHVFFSFSAFFRVFVPLLRHFFICFWATFSVFLSFFCRFYISFFLGESLLEMTPISVNDRGLRMAGAFLLTAEFAKATD